MTSTSTEPTDLPTESTEPAAAATGFPLNRRGVLLGAGATCAVAVLAACGSSGSSDTSSTPGSAAPTSDTPTSAAPTDDPSGAAQTGTEVATLSSIPVGSAVAAKLGDKPIVVARPTSTTAAAFSAICTHQGCTVAPAGETLNCPCHGSRYNAMTGQVLNGPATSSLPAVAVAVSNGKVIAT